MRNRYIRVFGKIFTYNSDIFSETNETIIQGPFSILYSLQSLQISSQFCQTLAKLDDYVNHNLLFNHDTWLWQNRHFCYDVMMMGKRFIFANVSLSTEKEKIGEIGEFNHVLIGQISDILEFMIYDFNNTKFLKMLEVQLD